MTKEQLENTPFWKNLPPDTEIVFATAKKGEDCLPVSGSDVTYLSEIVGWAKRNRDPLGGADPIRRRFLVINAKPLTL